MDRGVPARAQDQRPLDLHAGQGLAKIDREVGAGDERVVATFAGRIDPADLQRAGDGSAVQPHL